MCLAIPAKVIALEANDMAVVALEGVKKRISVVLLDEVAVGDYVLIHVGYALHRVSPEEAARTLALMAEAGILKEELEEITGSEA
ncbi:HypC/HybG/HupF family hydrogenase formation chaperone [Devosia sp.]|uniref:HypC/HybG/HupF family hydrogenase formation chaperone n=1 Tax=Devosia sp. TaxID=1871048 RepID=UPI0027353965|nr:HypC/HybG/HupF family hydrogenase formation chaperone [Devosia sp.]MDP2781869.1 HypC/HybG/HupF family hydrogenase formation chaperone [Devosia sp.]